MLIPALEEIIYFCPDIKAVVSALPVSSLCQKVGVINPFADRRQSYLGAKRLQLLNKVFIAEPVASHIYLAHDADYRPVFFLMCRYCKKHLFGLSEFFFRKPFFFYYSAYLMYAVPVCLFRFTGIFFIRPCLSQALFKYVYGNYALPCKPWKIAADHAELLIKRLILVRGINRHIFASHLVKYQPVIAVILAEPARPVA